MKSGKIIQIADLINDKLRKEQELEFYELELKKLLLRMQFVRQEIDLTNTIIDLIQKEEIPDIMKNISKYEVQLPSKVQYQKQNNDTYYRPSLWVT